MSDVPMIQVRGLYKTYRAGDVDVHALQGANLDVAKGEFVSIVGASGSGKSRQLRGPSESMGRILTTFPTRNGRSYAGTRSDSYSRNTISCRR